MPRWFLTIPPSGAARIAALHLCEAFEELWGKEHIKTFDTPIYLNAFSSLLKKPDDNMIADLLNQSLLVQCFDFDTTHLITTALCPVTLFALRLLRRRNVTCVHWFYEDFRRVAYWRDVVAGYDLFIAIQRGDLERHCRTAGTAFAYLPAGISAQLARTCPIFSSRSVDVAFVGLPSPYRIRILEALKKSGASLAIGGSGWAQYRGPLRECIASGSWMNERENLSLLQQARIGLNLSLDDPEKDRSNAQVSPRVFETMAMGCILVTEDTPLAAETLRGYRYHVFRDEKSLLALTAHLLCNHAEEQASLESNRARVLAHDTYRQRAVTIMDLIEKLHKPTSSPNDE